MSFLKSFSPTSLFRCAVVCLGVVSLLNAEDLRTSDGKMYKNIRVTGETPEAVKIMHDGGISMVPKKLIAADFLVGHELAPQPVTETTEDFMSSPQALGLFQKKSPTFKTLDGREFLSADISKVEPNGIKLVTQAGIVKIKFDELPTGVKTALDYDPRKAHEYAGKQAKVKEEQAMQARRIANASSQVEGLKSRLRLELVQNIGKGWLCAAEILADHENETVTARSGSPLSGPKVIFETVKKTETVAVGRIKRLMVFGLPTYETMSADLRSRRAWSGNVYRVGNYQFVSASTGASEIIMAAHIERQTAISWLAKNGNSVVYGSAGDVTVNDPGFVGTSTGTGFAISGEGHIATAAHVVAGADNIEVTIDGEVTKARVLASNEENDVALLKVDDVKTQPLRLVKVETLKPGADLMCVGYPLIGQLGVNPKLTKGALNALSGLSDDVRMIQMSVPIQPGNSGGPVCDMQGRVIAIVSQTGSTIAGARGEAGAVPQNVNFAMKSDLLMTLAISHVPTLKWSEPADKSTSPEDDMLAGTYLIRAIK